LQEIVIELSNFTHLRDLINKSDLQLFSTKYWIQQKPDAMKNVIGNQSVSLLNTFLDQVRVTKSNKEMAAMRRTCRLAVDALNSTIDFGKDQFQTKSIDQVNENQLAAHFEYHCRLNGSNRLSYPPVVAGAGRSITIHYEANNKPINRSEWVLMDAGCEDHDGYASDVTRCWPVDNQINLSSLHFALYQALCEVQKELIQRIEVNRTTLNQLLQEQTNLLGTVLKEFNLISKSATDQSTREAVLRFCPHHVSHYLGLDVHDSGSFSRDQPLTQGMCFTVEPGLYFRPDHQIPDEFKGIGFRVEDDLLINEQNQVENLTATCRYLP
jgi:Xaa-Pro aminopeptidase